MKKVIAVASGGGHWKQLMLIKSAFRDSKVTYITTIDGLPQESNLRDYKLVVDSNKNEKWKILISFFQLLYIFIRIRPNVVLSTGAAPGILSIFLGKMFFAKTIWVDSIANGEELSMGGSLSKKIANTVLTQWDSLVDDTSVMYKGSVL
jgi:UDP-N-acetylglucosamine:LPS N-acetylglucosamine transferase